MKTTQLTLTLPFIISLESLAHIDQVIEGLDEAVGSASHTTGLEIGRWDHRHIFIIFSDKEKYTLDDFKAIVKKWFNGDDPNNVTGWRWTLKEIKS